MVIDKALGLITLIFMITALAIVVSKKSNTVPLLSTILKGLRDLQKTAISPIQ